MMHPFHANYFKNTVLFVIAEEVNITHGAE